MQKKIKTFICFILTFAMLLTLLPPQAYEASTSMANASSQENYNDILQAPYVELPEGVSMGGTESTDDTSLEDAEIVMELTDRRTEYSKEYKLDNGLNLAVVYSEPVHYKENGKWKEIDNTLKAHGSGSSASYKNKAGAWQVEFPQQLDEESKVKITKGDYTVSFLMSGELRLDTAMTELRASVGTAKASKVKKSQGKVHKYDYSKLKEQAQHPEVIRDNLRSRMTYSDVYNNTDVIYDLDTQQLKESIVINTYDPLVYGYVYTLDTGKLVPVLNEDGSVDLLTKNKGEVVMTMPAPFMIDNEGSICTDVSVTLEKVKGTYQLTYLLPMEWVADEKRVWPVVLDPAVKVAPGTKTTNIQDHFVAENYSASNTHKYLYAGHHATYGDMRTYIRFSEIPDFAACDVLVNAKLKLYHMGGSSGLTIVEAHQVYDSWTTGSITWAGQPNFNTEIQDYCVVSSGTECSWDVTDIAHGWYLGENTGIMLKATTSVENSSTANWKSFCSVEYDKTNTTYWPYLEITYLTSEGIEDYWDYTTASAGRAGSGYVNNTTGNLTWVHSDLGFDGNIMPVSISHIYTLSERSETKYGLGKGWRTNFHQTVALSDDGDYYIWTDGDGTKHHFISNGTANTYVDEDGLRLKLQVFSSAYTITDIYGNTHNFDRYGRLISEVDNQSIKSGISISYDGTSNRIKEIRDGVGRVYKFTYNSSNLLTKIGYHGKNGSSGTEITNITFTYSSSKLTKITYKDETDSHFTYDGTKLLTAMDIDDNKVKFTYSTGITKRIASVEELDGSISGNKITIDYAHNKTKLTDREHTVIHHYNDYGNLISTQDEEGNATFYEYKANKYTETSVYGNQLRLASKEQNTVANLSPHGSFEKGNVWHNKTQSGIRTTTEKAYIGEYSLEVAAGYPTISISAYGEAITVDAGKSCTFSAFVQSESTSVQIGLGTTSTIYESSSSQNPGLDWKRLEVSYTNTSKSAVTIYPLVINHRGGYIYLDGVQIEMAAGASRYNLVENGDFRIAGYWSSDTGRTTVSDSAAPQLDAQAYKITGNPTTPQLIYQRIGVSGSAGDVYVLSGWAKGNSAPLYNTLHWFGIRVVFYNTDGSATAKFVSFNGTYDAAGDWEYTAGRVEADKNYSAIQVGMEYNNNVNDVYFDGIQLYREEFGERYDYDEDGNLSEVIDVLGRKTTYEYANNDLVKVIEPGGLTTVNTYKNHNLDTSTKSYTENGSTITLETYSYGYDVYGNQILAEVKAETVDDTGNKVNVVKRTTADYSTDRNHLASTTDELGNVTKYVYNQDTSVLEAVQYPKDTDGANNTLDTRTKYEYDEMFRLVKTTTTTDSGEEMSVEYSYDPDSNGKSMSDMLTQVSTGSSVYTFTYGNFSLRKNVKVGTTILAAYTYLNDADHSLESVTYGNGDKVEYSYDEFGRVTQEIYKKNGTPVRTITYDYNRLGALATVIDSQTGKTEIITNYFYDTFGRSTGMKETGGSKTYSLDYYYDDLGRLNRTSERYGDSYYHTEYTYNGKSQISQIETGNTTETYVYDEFERLTNWYTYHGSSTNPLITKLIKYVNPQNNSGYTSDRPRQWSYASDKYSVIYNYGYDANSNIVSEQGVKKDSKGTSVEVTTYVYDSANQLIRENNKAAGKTWVWTYNKAGNILTETEYAYTTGTPGTPLAVRNYGYGDSNWGDLLKTYNGKSISYDSIGNPLNDGTWTYTWKEGRKLATMSKSGTTWTFDYDANGMRTRRTTGSTTYNYTYHGSQLTHMTYVNSASGENITLHFYYDVSGRPLSFTYSDEPNENVTYYYVLNLQGDVVGILDSTGEKVVGYIYDAWGRLIESEEDEASALAMYNPLRYRGYVYDEETGLYYVSSRYYNPEIGRWINADGYVSTGQEVTGCNMFTYCGNNPVKRVDLTGKFWEEIETFLKNAGNILYNGIERVVNAAAGSFQIEAGVGYGLGASGQVGPIKASATAYQDGLTVGVKNGSDYTAIKGSAGILAEITESASIGFSTEYEHRFETNSVKDWDEHTTMSPPWEVYNCPKTVKDPFQVSFPIIKPIEGNLSQGFFIGVSAEVHIGVGGHFTIGWDADEFLRLLTE